jgi:ribosome biogenesis GTPase / thiamine phosphate phosphatase
LERSNTKRARVCFAAQERYRILIEDQEHEAVPAGSLRWNDELPAVGDWVSLRKEPAPGELALIESISARRNVISRKQAGRAHREQILAANVDLLGIVTAMDHEFNPRRLERYLVLAAQCGAPVVIVLNKAELCEDFPARVAELEATAPGIPWISLSAIQTVAPLRALTEGRTVVLLGSSGVGKSTIINGLIGQALQLTREVRAHDSRGRHTTTHRMLIPLDSGGALIDTPGLRELGLWATQPALDETFAEIQALAEHCRYRDCQHAGEPGCAVEDAIAGGELDPNRWASYQKLQGELRYGETRSNAASAAAEKSKWKAIHRAMRKHPKYNR